MTEKRYVTGQSQGEYLAELLNRKIDQRDWRLQHLQLELRKLFTGISTLTDKFRATSWDAEFPPEVKALIADLNTFLKTCTEFPQVFPVRPSGAPPFFRLEYAPTERAPVQRRVIHHICDLVRHGLLDRIRRCQRSTDPQGGTCGVWFFAKKSDSKYHSRECQMKTTEQRMFQKREYAKRRYWDQKGFDHRQKLRLRRGKK